MYKNRYFNICYRNLSLNSISVEHSSVILLFSFSRYNRKISNAPFWLYNHCLLFTPHLVPLSTTSMYSISILLLGRQFLLLLRYSQMLENYSHIIPDFVVTLYKSSWCYDSLHVVLKHMYQIRCTNKNIRISEAVRPFLR